MAGKLTVLVWFLDLKFLCEVAAALEELQIRTLAALTHNSAGDALSPTMAHS